MRAVEASWAGSNAMGGMTDPYRPILARLLEAAGAAALSASRTARGRLKPDGSEVCEADLRSEALLVEGLARAFPGAAVISEEGTRVEGRDGVWYVDPIDGTSAYLDGLAYWGPTVCLVCGGRPEVGALWLPRLRELWYARRGAGAWRNGTRLVARPDATPGRHDAIFLPSRFHRVGPIPWPGKVRALGSSATHLALVASGSGLATVVPRWGPWDVAAGLLLITEAGLAVTDPRGSPVEPLSGPAGLPFLAGARTALGLLSGDGWAERVLR